MTWNVTEDASLPVILAFDKSWYHKTLITVYYWDLRKNVDEIETVFWSAENIISNIISAPGDYEVL